jgi:hypothetical protein
MESPHPPADKAIRPVATQGLYGKHRLARSIPPHDVTSPARAAQLSDNSISFVLGQAPSKESFFDLNHALKEEKT